jgi:1-phosphofructokinase family hexose kinase
MRKSYILCGGLTPCIQRTIEFDAVTVGAVNRAIKVTESVGGKQINTARLVQTLGGHACAIGFCGGDNGRKLQELLDAEGLVMESVLVAGNSRICQTLLDRTAQKVTELVEELPPVSVAEQRAFIEHFLKMRAAASLITLSGTLPPGFPSDFYRTLIAGADVPVIIDTHGPALLESIQVAPLMVKLNEHELARTFCGESMEQGARRLLDDGVEWVLVTRGAAGAVLFSPTERRDFAAPKVHALNPIGSGDAVTAGIAYALSQNRGVPEAVQFGLACGSAQAETLVSGALDPVRARELASQWSGE